MAQGQAINIESLKEKYIQQTDSFIAKLKEAVEIKKEYYAFIDSLSEEDATELIKSISGRSVQDRKTITEHIRFLER